MRTVFVTVYGAGIDHIFLASGVLEQLVRRDTRVVLLVRAKSEDAPDFKYYTEKYASENVIVERIPPAMTRAELFWYHVSWNSIPSFTARVKRYDLFLKHRSRIRYAIESVIGALGHLRLWREMLRFVYRVIPDAYGAELFAKYKPDLVFCPSMFSAEDCRILRYARRNGYRTVTTMKSWDVPTTRGFTRVKADRILVFNDINRAETANFGDYPEDRITVIGFPQFDLYTHQDIYVSREQFFGRIGADPSKKLILFAVPGDFKNPYTHEVMLGIDTAISEGRFAEPVQILARFHPKYPATAEHMTVFKNVIMDRPGTYFSRDLERSIDAPASTTFQWTFSHDDEVHLANSLHHADVTVNTESTMTLDAAAHNRPVVLIGYDGNQRLGYWESIVRNYDREHFSAVLETKGARLAHGLDEFIELVNAYLKQPELDRKERDALRTRLLYKSDGQSARRVVDALVAEMAR